MSDRRNRISVAVLGATGTVGQRFVSLLADHPWFEVESVIASDRSAGKSYAEAVRWLQTTPLPDGIAARTVAPSDPEAIPHVPLVFSALDAAMAGPVERAFADAGSLVVSNARSHRLDPEVPLVVPEVNGDHLELIKRQRVATGGGAIVTNPNCSTIGLVLALKPLQDAFGVKSVHVVTMQAVSGAGLPGVPSIELLDNLIPYIPGEEEKMQAECRKILGRRVGEGVEEEPLEISAQCNRVPITDGHTLCVSVGLGRAADMAEVRSAFESFTAEPQELELPSAPARPVHLLDREDAPQPRLHRELDGGMATWIGRLRRCPLLDFRFVVLSHNTLRGAARGAILVGEQIVARGLLPGHAARD